MWALGGDWAALQTVEACGQEAGRYPRCLAVSGAQLVGGLWAYGGSRDEVRVWGLETLELQHALPQSAGASLWALLAVDGGVWASAGSDVAGWGGGACASDDAVLQNAGGATT